MAVAAMRTALIACGTGSAADHGEANWAAGSKAASAGGSDGSGGVQGDHLAEEFFSAPARQKRLLAAVNAVLEHAHTLLYDLPGPHCDSDSRHCIAGVAMQLLELFPLIADAPADDAADGAAASELAPEVQSRCDELLLRTERLPHLPAVLQRGSDDKLRAALQHCSDDKLRRMCIADAALVRCRASSCWFGARRPALHDGIVSQA